ncbi:amino acid permease [Bacillus alveayuensis]|uniref:amino acid permease n=1 Tax=Aeribacillus alveayuensis TaxID=279215 RepID=UPI001F2AF936|nr:amino acid permease [Bacillus alveayuensis]
MMNLLQKKSITHLLSQKKTLQKTLGAYDLILLGIGAIVGIGILVLTGVAAANDAGPSIIFSFMLAALVCGFVAFCYAEIASTLPVSGGVYTYAYVTIGEVVAYLIGWTQLLIYVLSAAAVANGWSAYFLSLLEGFHLHIPKMLSSVPQQGGMVNLPAVCIILLMTWVLSKGVQESKKVNNTMVAIKLSIILLFIIIGIFYVKPENWDPFMPFGWKGILAGTATVFFAFLGFDAVATAAEEVKNPQRDLPIGIIVSLGVCTLLYVIVCLVLTGMVPYHLLNVSDAMAFALHEVGQNFAAGVISVGAIAGITTVIFVYLYATVRVLFSMSRDHLLPKRFSMVHSHSQAPVFSTWIAGFTGAAIAGFIDLRALSNLVNIGALLTFVMVALSVIILRKTHPNLQRGFKAPLVPYLPILTIACSIFLMTRLALEAWLYFGIWMIIGLSIYFIYRTKRQKDSYQEQANIMKKAN